MENNITGKDEGDMEILWYFGYKWDEKPVGRLEEDPEKQSRVRH
jgi:hypothetical protein